MVLRLRFDDFARITRSTTLPEPTAETHVLLDAVRRLVDRAMPLVEQRGLTLLGISVGNLADDRAVQLALPFDRLTGGALDATLDDLRDRFGSSAVTRAVLLGRDQGVVMPMLPD
jgi:DNA polymerase-4